MKTTSAGKTQHAGGVHVAALGLQGASLHLVDDREEPSWTWEEMLILSSASFLGSGWAFYLIAFFLLHQGLKWKEKKERGAHPASGRHQEELPVQTSRSLRNMLLWLKY